MQKSVIRKNVEETTLDSYMAVNSIVMLSRLISLLGNNHKAELKDFVDSIRVKSLIWLISNQLFSSGSVNIPAQLRTLQLANIPLYSTFSSLEIADDLILLLRKKRTNNLKSLINMGYSYVISAVCQLLKPFVDDDGNINLDLMWTKIHDESVNCECCKKRYFIEDAPFQLVNGDSFDDTDISIRVCYNCGVDE